LEAEDIILHATVEQQDVAAFCFHVEDKADTLNVYDLINYNWQDLDGSLDFGPVKNNHWIKINIKNMLDEPLDQVIFIPYHHIHIIDVYIKDDDSVRLLGSKGTMRLHKGEFLNSGYSFPFRVQANSAISIIIKFEHLYRPLRASTFLLSESKLTEITWKNYRLLWFWRGAFLFALLISLIIYFFVGLRLFVYYFLLNLGIGLFIASQLGDYFLFYRIDTYDVTTVLDFTGAIMVCIFFPLFLNSLSPIKKRNPKMWYGMYVLIYSMLLIYFINMFPQARLSVIQYYSHIYIMMVAAIVFSLQLILLFKSMIYRDKNAAALFFIYGFYVLSFFANVSLPNMGLMPSTPRVYSSLLLVSLVEIFTFMILMGREALRIYKHREFLIISEEEHQHQMVLSVIKAQEEERNRVGRILHDSIGGNLAVVKQNYHKNKTETLTILNKTIESIRNLSHGLVSPMFKHDEFVDELKELCYLSTSDEMKFHCYFHKWTKPEKDETITHLYRIVQELVQNAVKHSKAKNVYFQFIGEEKNIINILYEDDGIGFDIETISSNGLGLKNIQNRIEVMNGNIRIESSATTNGTSMFIEVES
jgi:signal transduction histidine kinase